VGEGDAAEASVSAATPPGSSAGRQKTTRTSKSAPTISQMTLTLVACGDTTALSNYVQRPRIAPDRERAGAHHFDDVGAFTEVGHELRDLDFARREFHHEAFG